MTYPEQLLAHANALLAGGVAWDPVNLRRAVSAAYYALFHQINQDAASLIAPNVPIQTNHRIQRWFEHGKMKETCGRFLRPKLDQPLLGLVGSSASSDLQLVCDKFIALQNARHDADYDLSYAIDFTEALTHLIAAAESIEAWKRIRDTPEANIFILSLLLWKNWEEKQR